MLTANCEIDKAFSDLYSWLMVFTPEMEFKFPPGSFEGYPAISWFIPYKSGGKNYYLVMHFYRGTENFPSFMALFGNDGKMIRKKDINMDESWFSFTINMRENIDRQLRIPKMLMHIFVENAVKHGLRHLDSGGELLIAGQRDRESLYISITDKGIGREKAKTYAGFSTGKGLSIMNQILDSYYSLYRIKTTYRIIDLFHNNSASGTKVIIRIPVRI